MFDLWSEASRDAEAEESTRRLHAAKARVAGTWAFLANAATTEEFAQRKEMAVEALADAVWAVTADANEAEETWVRLHASLDEDFEIVSEARRLTAGSHEPRAYAYDADIHCPGCTTAEHGIGKDGFIGTDSKDSEGNNIHAVFPWDEHDPHGEHCGDCGGEIEEPYEHKPDDCGYSDCTGKVMDGRVMYHKPKARAPEVSGQQHLFESSKEAKQGRPMGCPECGHTFDGMRYDEHGDAPCPHCGNPDTEDVDRPQQMRARDTDFDDHHSYASRLPFDPRRVTAYNDAEESQASSERANFEPHEHPQNCSNCGVNFNGNANHINYTPGPNGEEHNHCPTCHSRYSVEEGHNPAFGTEDDFHDEHYRDYDNDDQDPHYGRDASKKTANHEQDNCVQCQVEEPGYHAGLHAGHIWTNTSCPAYKSRNGDDCTCSQKTASAESECGICGTRLTGHKPAEQHPETGNWSFDEHYGEDGQAATGGEGNRNGGHWHRPSEGRAPVSNPKVHTFDSTGEAYDSSQTEDHIKDGDVLSVPSEGVHGYLHRAWPMAVVHPGNPGAFHTMGEDGGYHEDKGRYEESKAKAREVAGHHGASKTREVIFKGRKTGSLYAVTSLKHLSARPGDSDFTGLVSGPDSEHKWPQTDKGMCDYYKALDEKHGNTPTFRGTSGREITDTLHHDSRCPIHGSDPSKRRQGSAADEDARDRKHFESHGDQADCEQCKRGRSVWKDSALHTIALVKLADGGFIIVDATSGYKVAGPFASRSDAEAAIASGKFSGKNVKVEQAGADEKKEEDAHPGGRGQHDEAGGSKPFDDKGHHRRGSRLPFG